MNFQTKIEEFEINLMREALQNNKGNRAATARDLEMKRTTLVEKMKRYGLSDEFPVPSSCKHCQELMKEIVRLKNVISSRDLLRQL